VEMIEMGIAVEMMRVLVRFEKDQNNDDAISAPMIASCWRFLMDLRMNVD